MHWTAGFRLSRVASAIGRPPVVRIVSKLPGVTAVNIYFKVFVSVGLIVAGCVIGKALVTGSILLRGTAEPIRRQERPREYWNAMRIVLVVFAIIVALFAWMSFS
jgi:hypothetical protein